VRVTVVAYGLPHEATRYPKADAVMLCWNSTGIPAAVYAAFLREGSGGEAVVYPATMEADGAISVLDARMSGVLPLNIPKVKKNFGLGKIVYQRGFGMNYSGGTGTQGANVTPIPMIQTVRMQKPKYIYTGSAIHPEVVVRDRNGSQLQENVDYTLSGDNGKKDVGEYKVQINFTGNYSGNASLDYQIFPKKTNITKVQRDYGGFTVRWEKRGGQISGYQIQYGLPKNYRDNAKIITTKTPGKTSRNIDDLKSNALYCVRVRTYKTLSDGRRLVSGWSSLEKVKTK
ncbi:MAG: fibronectin type III domain-containing protein, partial [Lachnospiraceae bacterium]|nr:fibronectin type III domain-containing protein [Lachnospiraceae bacterium]